MLDTVTNISLCAKGLALTDLCSVMFNNNKKTESADSQPESLDHCHSDVVNYFI